MPLALPPGRPLPNAARMFCARAVRRARRMDGAGAVGAPKARLPGAEVVISTGNTPEVLRRVEEGASTPRW